jgi:hypothetical protein
MVQSRRTPRHWTKPCHLAQVEFAFRASRSTIRRHSLVGLPLARLGATLTRTFQKSRLRRPHIADVYRLRIGSPSLPFDGESASRVVNTSANSNSRPRFDRLRTIGSTDRRSEIFMGTSCALRPLADERWDRHGVLICDRDTSRRSMSMPVAESSRTVAPSIRRRYRLRNS